MIRRGPARYRFRLAALAAVAVLVALALFVYSPWHQHDPFSARTCPLCHFQHLPALAAAALTLVPLILAVGLAPGGSAASVAPAPLRSRFGRAPPLPSLAA